jgi:hypothetical protein
MAGLLAFIGSIAAAGTYITEPGCYEVQGKVVDIRGTRLKLRVAGGSRSEVIHDITLDGKPGGLEANDSVQLIVQVAETGATDRIPMIASRKSIKLLVQQNPNPTGKWTKIPCEAKVKN